jgi:hypothetical protein
MGRLYGRAGRLTAENGGSRPGQEDNTAQAVQLYMQAGGGARPSPVKECSPW